MGLDITGMGSLTDLYRYRRAFDVDFLRGFFFDLGNQPVARLGRVISHGGNLRTKLAPMGRGLGHDGLHQGFIFLFRDGKNVAIFHFQNGVFQVPGDGEEGLKIGGNLVGLKALHTLGYDISETVDRGNIKRCVGHYKGFPVSLHLGHFLDRTGMLLLILLQVQPEVFFPFPEPGTKLIKSSEGQFEVLYGLEDF